MVWMLRFKEIDQSDSKKIFVLIKCMQIIMGTFFDEDHFLRAVEALEQRLRVR